MHKRLRVNVVSESAFTVQGHGVHTAFEETVRMLQWAKNMTVASNSNLPADIVHIHTVGVYSLWKLLFSRGRKVISAHVTPDSFVGSLVGARTWYPLARWYLRWFYNRADGVLAVSHEVQDELKELGITKPVYLMPNTIDVRPYKSTPAIKKAARKHLGIGESEFVVICCGQVQPRKRVDTFIQCARDLPDVKFVWVGGVPFKRVAADYGHMKHLMADHPVNVTFTGVISHADVVAYYQAADLFFLPSVQETFGIVVIEAVAAGLPVLLRDIDQYEKTFKGWYLKGDERSFTGIIHHLQHDKKAYATAVKQSAPIAEEYSSERGRQLLLDIYTQVLQR
ncbi:MAG TPA: glycosyltransferase [Candidatus Saccharimonadales bacterium]|nr:glycosyltransferase [Candidatus Saccharimonadales bacterium]